MLVAVFRDLDPADKFHDEIRATGFGRSRVKHLVDVGVVHQRHCLALGFKAGNHALRVHSRLDNFQRDPSSDGCLLFGHVNHPASALTNLLEQLVMAHVVARFFSRRKHLSSFWWPLRWRSAKEIACLFVSLQQGFDSEAELDVSLASLAQISIALLRWKPESLRENSNIRVRSTVHFTNKVFCYLPVEFFLRSDDVRSTHRPVSHDLRHGRVHREACLQWITRFGWKKSTLIFRRRDIFLKAELLLEN